MQELKSDSWPREGDAPGTPRILIYAGDIHGLGHLRRNGLIAAELVRRWPDANILLLTSVASGQLFGFPPQIDVVKLPSVEKVADGSYRPRLKHQSIDAARDLRAGIIHSVVRAFRPDLMLVDHRPGGLWGELLGVFDDIKTWPQPPQVVLGLRDVLGGNAVIDAQFGAVGGKAMIDATYDRVLIYGEPPSDETAADPKRQYCGYIVSDALKPAKHKAKPGTPTTGPARIVVTAGGGHDGFDMISAAIKAMGRLDGPPADMVCITGPLMDAADRKKLTQLAKGMPVRIKAETPPDKQFAGADLIIIMGGYNTVLEAIALRKKTICIPRARAGTEQLMRGSVFHDRGYLTRVLIEDAKPEHLAGVMQRALQADRPNAPLPDLDGVARAVSAIEDLLSLSRPDRGANDAGRE